MLKVVLPFLIIVNTLTAELLPFEQRPSTSVYISVGDCLWNGNLTPVNCNDDIQIVFDTWKSVYKCNRIFWRGAQDEIQLAHFHIRSECPIYAQLFASMYITYKWQDLNTDAIIEAHKRDMRIYVYHALFDYGGTWQDGFNDYQSPYYGTDELVEEHPEFSPVDKHGHRSGSGTICFAYPEARRILAKRLADFVIKHGYDGIMFYTYVENFSQRFNDEFGYNEPIVNEFQKRYGIDITKDKFDKTAWHKLQGEYLTMFLKELHDLLARYNKGLGITLYEGNTHYPSPWVDNMEMRPAGNIYLDWENWTERNIVDELLVVQKDGEKMPQLLGQIQDELQRSKSKCKLSFITPSFAHDQWNKLTQRGIMPVIGDGAVPADRGYEETQTREVVLQREPYAKLAYIGQLVAKVNVSRQDINDILVLACDTHPLVRRKAILSIGQLRIHDGLELLNRAAFAPEVAIRAAAFKSMASVHNEKTAVLILRSLRDDNTEFILLSSAMEALASLPAGEFATGLQGLYDRDPVIRMTTAWSIACAAPNLGRPEALPILIDLLRADKDMRVRYCAAWALKHYNDERATDALKSALCDRNLTVQLRAATSLPCTVKMTTQQETESQRQITAILVHKFRKYDSNCTQLDADWGWRTMGNSLLACGKSGKSELEGILSNTSEDLHLRQMAFLVLRIPQTFDRYQTVTEEENDQIWCDWPK